MKKSSLFMLCVAAAMTITGCSSKSSSSSSSSSKIVIGSVTEPVQGQVPSEPVTQQETTAEQYVTNGDEGELTDKEVIDILSKTMQAGIDRDYAAFNDSSNIYLSYYLSKGEWLKGDDMAEFMKTDASIQAFLVLFDSYGDLDVHFVNPELVDDEELEKINSYIPKIAKNCVTDISEDAAKLKFDGAYKAYLRYKDQPEEYYGARMYVVKFEGKWMTDAYVTFVMEQYGEFKSESQGE